MTASTNVDAATTRRMLIYHHDNSYYHDHKDARYLGTSDVALVECRTFAQSQLLLLRKVGTGWTALSKVADQTPRARPGEFEGAAHLSIPIGVAGQVGGANAD